MKSTLTALAMALVYCWSASTKVSYAAQYPEYYDFEPRVFYNIDCESTASCDLVLFSLSTEKWKIVEGDDMFHGTIAVMGYQTKTFDTLERYGIVQFIRGCGFRVESAKDSEAKSCPIPMIKENFSKQVPLHFLQWSIDSLDKDPMYASMPGYPRHYSYLSQPYSHNQETNRKHYYGIEKPSQPRLYVADLGMAAAKIRDTTYNFSLEFKTCIYHTRDIPQTTDPENVDFAKPIHCFWWQGSYVYNDRTRQFESPATRDPFCTKLP